ncbi:hypothetical protein [Parasedimentitalea huanghaiensis]|uniref:Uncharacterized protein n=1 Tax=Parasedimentitalea huanghaiensis TaxID=2682100 RepID=A0A6L6WGL0_9RHOB|nr:hypothetical protein [Zongyanglinia huanghaiensis]MVO16834.1 hypothetical protein [Zongyanglinia huanghaiensis]
MKKPCTRVSDHAVIRYLERVQGVDIKGLRHRIGRVVDLYQDHPHATGVISRGFSYKIRNGVVTTVIPVQGNRRKPKHRFLTGGRDGRR